MERTLWLLVCVAATANAAPKCPTLEEVAAAAGDPPGLDVKLTPPLPATWPPSGAPSVRYFDFRTQALPSGVVAYSIESPSTEITVPLDGGPTKKRSLGKRTKLGRYQPPIDPPKVDVAAASAVLLTVLCENRMPNEAEAAKLRAGYGPWLNDQVLIRAWLTVNSSPFATWVVSKPVPPPAPPGARLTARLEGDAVVLTRDGKSVRFESAGLQGAQLSVVPLRADGNEPALWITAGQQGMLVRFADPPQVIYGVGFNAGGQRGLFSKSRSVWLMDMDGDGFNDVVQHTTDFSDVGAQNEGPQVFRYDPLLGNFTADDKLNKKASWVSVSQDTRPEKLIAKALGVPSVEPRGGLDLGSERLPTPPPPNTLGASGSLPFVGADLVVRVIVRRPGQKAGGHTHLAHLRYGKEPALVSLINLGDVGSPVKTCGDRTEELRREGDSVVVVWPIDADTLVEQRVRFDGKTLVKPEKPPVKVADCGS